MKFHWGPRTPIFPDGPTGDRLISVSPYGTTGGYTSGAPVVNFSASASAADKCKHLEMTPGNARIVAEIIDALSGATPEQQREFTEGIRASAQSVEMEAE
jgi:hypothetical protein